MWRALPLGVPIAWLAKRFPVVTFPRLCLDGVMIASDMRDTFEWKESRGACTVS